MKKTGIILGFVLAGFFLGYLVFNGHEHLDSEYHDHEHTDEGRWTCSMHPEIDGKEGDTCPLCGMDLVHTSKAKNQLAQGQLIMTEDAIALANVRTMVLGEGKDQVAKLRLSGTITTNMRNDAVQTTLFDGRIDKLYADYIGKYVQKGEVIGRIYSPELYAAQDKLLTSASYRETHPKLYAAARSTLGLWKMTDAQIDEMLKRGKPMVNFPLHADVSGTIVEVLASEGNYYKQGSTIYRVAKLSSLWAVFDVYQDQLKSVEKGQEIAITSKAFPELKVNGKIAYVEPLVRNTDRVAKAVVVIQKPKLLKPGVFVEGMVSSNYTGASKVYVPKSAVLWTGKQSVVYKKPFKDRPIFELQEVKLGESMVDEYAVLEGLEFGDEVVVNGAFTIDASAQLQGKMSMMNARKGAAIKDIKDLKDLPKTKELIIQSDEGMAVAYRYYFDLKDALVQSNYKKAVEFSLALKTHLDDLSKNEIAENHWAKTIDGSVDDLVGSSNLEQIRKHFKQFSQHLVEISENANQLPQTIYVQYCPMADQNRGAKWLSLQKEIRNPYFGDKMLICGTLEQTLQ